MSYMDRVEAATGRGRGDEDRYDRGESSRRRDQDVDRPRHRSERDLDRRSVSPGRRRSDGHRRDEDASRRRSGEERRDRDGESGGRRHRNHDEGRDTGHHRRSRSHSGDGDRDQHRRRSRSRERRDRGNERDKRRSRTRSESDSDSSDDLNDSDDDERRRRKRKERKREEKEERRRRKERKREKKARKEKNTVASTGSWGKYGIISEIDLPKKDSEFRAWLVEEKKLNPETISRDRTKKEFGVFVEDYNTATLPHEKYYNMAKYEFKMNMIRSGQTLPLDEGSYDPLADMKAHTSHVKSMEEKKQSKLTREDIMELRRVEAERIEIGKRRLLGLDVPRNMGVRTEQVSLESVNFD